MRIKGHAGQGGLQHDSIGELYPLAVIVFGDGHGEVHNLATGEKLAWCKDYKHAWMLAEEVKQSS